jgi:hypothetical protein
MPSKIITASWVRFASLQSEVVVPFVTTGFCTQPEQSNDLRALRGKLAHGAKYLDRFDATARTVIPFGSSTAWPSPA